MSRHHLDLLPDGRPWVAEGHDLTTAGLDAVADGRAERHQDRVWTWSAITEGDQRPGG